MEHKKEKYKAHWLLVILVLVITVNANLYNKISQQA